MGGTMASQDFSAAAPSDPAHRTDSTEQQSWDQRIAALSSDHPLKRDEVANSALIRTLRGLGAPHTPVWFMRQAGRSLPEYREAREGTGMLEACLTPELAAEITVQPVRRHKVDAGIFFSDIVVPMKLAGVGVDIVAGRGPVLDQPVRTAADVAALPELPDAALDPIREAVSRTVDLLGDTPLIGFAGAPFTIAAYAVEGGPSRDHLRPRTMMHADPQAWDALAQWAARTSGAFLRAQVQAGASAVQLFDSWAGSLSLADYLEHVQRHSADALAAVADLGVPRIHFGTGTGELLAAMRDAGADAVGVDYRIPLDTAVERVGKRTVVQGNIDPALLAAPRSVLHEHARDVLRRGQSALAHVVNLGHGVPPETDPEVLTDLVAFIHKETQ
ncbi:uroporphyrinogen decarboxylase [Kocuria sp. WRN011]|nr:uroporphyrinogen decarboxylase [Kocuria sp. WRN011]PZP37816.1 MAG: uroporphyrinogen decarboxylase [Kocuria rhizophila]